MGAPRDKRRGDFGMQSISTGITNLIARLDPEEARALKIARNNKTFEEAVRLVWKDNPDAASYLLAHVNSIYAIKDETLRKSAYRDERIYSLTVCMDDSMAKSERNARGAERYWCYFYVRDYRHMTSILKAYERDIVSKARRLGLNLHSIGVRQSPDAIKGERVFPKCGDPIPLIAYQIKWEAD